MTAREEAEAVIYEAAYYFHYGIDAPTNPGKRTPDRDEEMSALAHFIVGRMPPRILARWAAES